MTSMPAPHRCLYCGGPITDTKSRGRSRKYCSDEHRYAARRQRQATDPDLGTQEFATVLRDAIESSEHSARWLANQVTGARQQLSAPSLSEWRAGKSIPYLNESTRDSLLALERLLPTEPTRLVRALERTALARGKGGWPDWQPPRSVPTRGPAALKAKLEADGITNRGKVTVVEAREVYTIGADRRPEGSRNTYRVWTLRPGVDRYVVMLAADDRNPAEVVAGSHCRLGERHRLSTRRYSLHAVELLLEEKVGAFEPYDLEFSVRNPRPGTYRLPMPGWMRVVQDPGCRLLQMGLRFAGQPPRQVWRVTWRQDRGIPRPASEDLVTSDDGLFERELTNPDPGSWGFRWRWPGAMEVAPPAGRRPR